MLRWIARLLLGAALIVAAPASAQAAAEWRLAQPAAPAPPEGVEPARFPVPLGQVQDIRFWSPSRGLMLVRGNGASVSGQDGVVKEGLYRFDGARWTPFSSVCGARNGDGRIVWAGPLEFWTIAQARAENRTLETQINTLCHFKDGQIVASYATSQSDANAYLPMQGGACFAPDNCWFGGDALEDEPGAFHLHWNGQDLERVIAPQGRQVTDLEPFDGRIWESVTNAQSSAPAKLTTPEPAPLLLRSILPATKTITTDPFVSTSKPRLNADQFTALDADATHLWAAGGQANTGPDSSTSKLRPPLLAVRLAGAQEFKEVPLDRKAFTGLSRISAIAANPGTGTAWLAVASGTVPPITPRLIKIDAAGQILDDVKLPLAADPDPNAIPSIIGQPTSLDCPATDDCWLGTDRGWLFHLSSGAATPVDDEPYLQTFLSTRPADATSVPDLSDALPVDDSGADLPFLDATIKVQEVEDPPVLEAPPSPRASNVKVRAISRKTVEVSFRLSLRATVELKLLRGKKVVARAKRQVLGRGPHAFRFRVSVKRWPNNIKLDVTNA